MMIFIYITNCMRQVNGNDLSTYAGLFRLFAHSPDGDKNSSLICF